MKRILYLTFYFEPDLCAGSFRNTPLVKELAEQCSGEAVVDVITTMPNRYRSYRVDAPEIETGHNYTVRRIRVPGHESGMIDQIRSFKAYYDQVLINTEDTSYDLVVASSSRLFTAYLGRKISEKLGVPLYLDIRDLFYDTLQDVLEGKFVKPFVMPLIKFIERRTFKRATHINLISKGFESYFSEFNRASYSFYPNGVDDVFILGGRQTLLQSSQDEKTVIYAGNIGEGQGLHKIIPQFAKRTEGRLRFLIIGDGGAKQKLELELKVLDVQNVEILPPMKRSDLIDNYKKADFLFVHLNDLAAFEKVLPSKIFELAAFPKPIIAGLGGYSAEFIRDNVENCILFEPCNVNNLIDELNNYVYEQKHRVSFVETYDRRKVNGQMAESILGLIR